MNYDSYWCWWAGDIFKLITVPFPRCVLHSSIVVEHHHLPLVPGRCCSRWRWCGDCCYVVLPDRWCWFELLLRYRDCALVVVPTSYYHCGDWNWFIRVISFYDYVDTTHHTICCSWPSSRSVPCHLMRWGDSQATCSTTLLLSITCDCYYRDYDGWLPELPVHWPLHDSRSVLCSLSLRWVRYFIYCAVVDCDLHCIRCCSLWSWRIPHYLFGVGCRLLLPWLIRDWCIPLLLIYSGVSVDARLGPDSIRFPQVPVILFCVFIQGELPTTFLPSRSTLFVLEFGLRGVDSIHSSILLMVSMIRWNCYHCAVRAICSGELHLETLFCVTVYYSSSWSKFSVCSVLILPWFADIPVWMNLFLRWLGRYDFVRLPRLPYGGQLLIAIAGDRYSIADTHSFTLLFVHYRCSTFMHWWFHCDWWVLLVRCWLHCGVSVRCLPDPRCSTVWCPVGVPLRCRYYSFVHCCSVNPAERYGVFFDLGSYPILLFTVAMYHCVGVHIHCWLFCYGYHGRCCSTLRSVLVQFIKLFTVITMGRCYVIPCWVNYCSNFV